MVCCIRVPTLRAHGGINVANSCEHFSMIDIYGVEEQVKETYVHIYVTEMGS